MALHRAGGIRQAHRGNPSTAAATTTVSCPFGDMSMTDSSGGERKSGDDDQGNTTDPEMPPLVEDPVPPDGGDPRQDEEGDTSAAVPRTVNGRRHLGWTRLRGHQYEKPRENREGTAQRMLDASAAPWQPPLPPSSLRQQMLDASEGLGSSSGNNDVRQALGYPVYSLRRRPREDTDTAQRMSDASADTISFGPPLPPSNPRVHANGDDLREAERPDGVRRRTTGTGQPLECYLCNGNHFIRDCPKRETGRTRVFYLWDGNHFVRDCPKRESNAEKEAAGQ